MAIIKIGSSTTALNDMPDPSELELGLQDIDAGTTTRSANGKMLRDRVCGGATAKRKLILKWHYVDANTAKTILQAIRDEFFYVSYPDAYTGGNRTARFYAGDRKLPMYNAVIKNGSVLWTELAVDLIEQ